MDQQAYDLIFAIPPDVDYASLPRDLGIEDIPWKRIPGLTVLMRGNDSYVALEAAMVLCSWANSDGFEYLRTLVCDKPPLRADMMPHHLRGTPGAVPETAGSVTVFRTLGGNVSRPDIC